MKIGLIGLGNMGFHFGARLLAAGHELAVCDRSREAVARLTKKGARAAHDVSDLASRVEIAFLSLPTPDTVIDVVTRKGGLSDGGTVRIIVDLSTSGPTATLEVQKALEGKGIALIGAPVSGGTVAAEKGTLAVMAAGPKAAYDEILPLLEILGRSQFYLGEDPTLGQTMKIINNTLYATTIVASSEVLVYGVKAGLDPQTMLDVINVSSGRSFSTQERIPQCVLDRSFPMRFATGLLHKDIKMCVDEAEKIGAPLMISPVVRQFLAFAITQGDGDRDNACTIQQFEKWAGVQVGIAPKS